MNDSHNHFTPLMYEPVIVPSEKPIRKRENDTLPRAYTYLPYLIAIVLAIGISVGQSTFFRPQTMSSRASTSGASVSIQPSTVEVQLGEQFSVDVFLDTKGLAATGADVRIAYDAQFLNIVRVESAQPNVFTKSGVIPSPDILSGPVSSVSGVVSASLGTGPVAGGVVGVGSMIKIYATAKEKYGITTITVDPATYIGVIGTNGANGLAQTTAASISIVRPTLMPTPTVTSGDTAAPSLTILSPLDGYVVPAKGTVKFSVKASDTSGIGLIRLSMDGVVLKECLAATACQTSIASGKISAGTIHELQAVAIDASPLKLSTTRVVSIRK